MIDKPLNPSELDNALNLAQQCFEGVSVKGVRNLKLDESGIIVVEPDDAEPRIIDLATLRQFRFPHLATTPSKRIFQRLNAQLTAQKIGLQQDRPLWFAHADQASEYLPNIEEALQHSRRVTIGRHQLYPAPEQQDQETICQNLFSGEQELFASPAQAISHLKALGQHKKVTTKPTPFRH